MRARIILFFNKKQRGYYAVDHVSSMPQNELRNIIQLPGTAETIPLDNDFADIVICNQVIEHLLNPLLVFKEISRILKPGGLFVGSAPHISPIYLEPHDYWRFTEYGIKSLLLKSNFENICVNGNGGALRAVALLIAMDVLLSRIKEGSSQIFHVKCAMILFPLIGLISFTFHVLDRLIPDKKRSSANLCWIAAKPATGFVLAESGI